MKLLEDAEGFLNEYFFVHISLKTPEKVKLKAKFVKNLNITQK